ATAPTAIYPLSLHDALPILNAAPISSAFWLKRRRAIRRIAGARRRSAREWLCCIAVWPLYGAISEDGCLAGIGPPAGIFNGESRSEEHTSELQSRENLVCRL